MRLSSLLVLLCATTLPSSGVAAPPTASQAAANSSCPKYERNALSELGCELGTQLELTDATVVATAPLRSDVPLERADELAQRLVRVIGGAMGSGLLLQNTPMTLGEARQLAGRTGRLLYLTPELRDGTLHVTGDLYLQARAFWDRVKAPVGGPQKHAYAERRADGEIRSFLPRPPLVVSQKNSAPLPDRPVLSLACGSLEGAAGDRIALIGRRRLTVGQLRKGAVERHAQREWQELSPIAPAPLRSPLAASRLEGGWLDVGSSDRLHALRLDGTLQALVRSPRVLPWPGGGCAPLGAVGALAHLIDCFDEAPLAHLSDWVAPVLSESDPIDAFAAARVVRADGSSTRLVALRPAGQRSTWLFSSGGRRVEVPNTGAQLALADLDGDGEVEIISSRPVLDASQDTVRVDTWQADGRLTSRFEMPLPDVHAIAVCPWSGQGMAPFLVAAGESLWVFQ